MHCDVTCYETFAYPVILNAQVPDMICIVLYWVDHPWGDLHEFLAGSATNIQHNLKDEHKLEANLVENGG